ncbi:MAG: hypothetical protein ABIP62_16625 [Vicinamibacteria bacterium]
MGKSTLIAAFLSGHPNCRHEPEAFEILGDDIDLTDSGIPTSEGLRALLTYTASSIESHRSQDHVIFERSPVDYLGYAAAAGRAWTPGEVEEFITSCVPVVRASVQHLDLIAYLPIPSNPLIRRSGENQKIRRRVDGWLRRILLDDEYDLFERDQPPLIVELPATPEDQLSRLDELASSRRLRTHRQS